MLYELKNKVRSRTVYYDKIVKTIDGLMSDKPCTFVRLSYEMAMFRPRVEHNEMVLYLLDEEPWGTFLRREIVQIHPFIRPFVEEQCWAEFYEKYMLM